MSRTAFGRAPRVARRRADPAPGSARQSGGDLQVRQPAARRLPFAERLTRWHLRTTALVQGRRHLPSPRQIVLRRQRRRHRRLQRAALKLDYIKNLGATCIWLLPFYPSPLRDDGYDIADYRGVNPAYGTLRDFRDFVRARTTRGIRVITELVVNHTSDQHPWFSARACRQARFDLSQFLRLERYRHAVRGRAHHLHRHRELELDLGLGRRRSTTGTASSRTSPISTTITRAWSKPCSTSCGSGSNRASTACAWTPCPYLVEREGTNCENLPETHAVLKEHARRARRGISRTACLLAEANQWPEDVRRLFRRRRRVPHGVSLPAHAAHVHGDRRRGPLSDHRHHAPDAGHSRQLLSGRSFCATTTR